MSEGDHILVFLLIAPGDPPLMDRVSGASPLKRPDSPHGLTLARRTQMRTMRRQDGVEGPGPTQSARGQTWESCRPGALAGYPEQGAP